MSRSLETLQQENSLPRKKPRSGLSNEVSDLNLKGISYMLSGNEEEAERCFSQALAQVDRNLLSRVCCAYTLGSYELEPASCSTEKVYGPPQTTDSDEKGVNDNSNVSLLYIYQRQEYDEGMYAYKDALPLEDFSSEYVCSATLLYNMAQTNVHRGTYLEAKISFELSLVRLKMANATPIYLLRIYHNLGHCFYRLGKDEDALRCYKKALAISVDSHLGCCHIASANVAIAVLLFNGKRDLDGCLNVFESSLSVYQVMYGESSKEVATILNNVGRAQYIKANYVAALHAFERALKIRRNCLGKSSIDSAATVCSTAQTHHHLGNLDRAMEYYKEFLEIAAQHRPGAYNYEGFAIVYKCVIEIHRERDDMEQAKVAHEKALAVGRVALGRYHPNLIATLHQLGDLHYEMRDLDAALQSHTEALSVARIVLDPCHPQVLVTLMNVALIHRLKDNFSAALVTYAEVYSLQIKLLGPNSMKVANTLTSMGWMEYQLKAYSAAFDTYQAALRIQRDHYQTDDHLEIAATLNSIGSTVFKQGGYSLAKNFFRDSLRIRLKLLGPNHRDVSILWFNLATIHLETGEDDLAIRLYREAVRVERLSLGERHHDLNFIRTLQGVGLVHHNRGQLDEALDYFCQAYEIVRTMIMEGGGGGGSTGDKRNSNKKILLLELGKLLNSICNIHLWKANVDEMMRFYTEVLRIYQQEDAAGLLRNNEPFLVVGGYRFYGLGKLHPPCAAMA